MPIERLKQPLRELNTGINEVLIIPRKNIFYLFLVSLLDRFSNYFVTIILVTGLGINLSIFQVLSANILSSLSDNIPLSSIGNFGTFELGWAGALMFYEIPKELAILSAFAVHTLTSIYSIIFGIASILLLVLKCKINPVKQIIYKL